MGLGVDVMCLICGDSTQERYCEVICGGVVLLVDVWYV